MIRRTLLICLVLLCLPAAAGAAYGPFAGAYGGKVTSNAGHQSRHPMELELTANGKRIKAFVTYWHTRPCAGTGGDFAGATTVNRAPLKRSGAFSNTVRFSEPNPDDRTQRLNHEVTLSGRVGKRGASGSYRDVIRVTAASGATLTTCDTGTVRWSARRGKGHYAGTSAPEFPLSLTRNRAGTRASLFLQWRADCGGGTFLERAATHKGIRVRRSGRFSKSGSLSFTTDKGAKVTGSFSLAGRFSGRRVSGRYSVNATGTSTNGQRFTCTLKRMRFSARRG